MQSVLVAKVWMCGATQVVPAAAAIPAADVI